MCHRTQTLMIQDCIHRLYLCYYQVYGQQQLDYANLMVEVANFTLHQILQSNAPYHNVEHTILVTLTGQAILRGKYLSEKNVNNIPFVQHMISLPTHIKDNLRNELNIPEKVIVFGGLG